MKRPWQVWLAFALCGALVAAAMAWLTSHALRVDRERSAARAEAELEQRVSLALWRMDTKLAPMIAEETARPHSYYEPFIAVNPMSTNAQMAVQVASPLLANPPSNVILNFDASRDGQWKSPQAPPPEQAALAASNGLSGTSLESNRTRLESLAREIDVESLIAQLPAQPLRQWATNQMPGAEVEEDPFGGSGQSESSWQAASSPDKSILPNSPPLLPNADPAEQRQGPNSMQGQQVAAKSQPQGKIAKGIADYGERSGRLQQATQQEYSKFRAGNYLASNAPPSSKAVVENISRPLWVGDQLLLARRVERGGQTFVQGSWLDWPRLKRELLAETADLLPKADLAPAASQGESDPTRVLAALPVQLIVGDTAVALAAASAFDAPLQWALTFGWMALLLALAAVAALLWGVLALSERRAAFVSSVTHELRTPLTTFRMYAEMLARDMVPTPERRREYLETLKTEAERLTHLVENVLSYARLERGRTPKRSERTTPGALVERFCARLAERADRAGMRLECEVDADLASASLLTDVGVVEQILFNLVDNAAKYAARAEDRRICLHASRDGNCVTFRVSDFGPGFASLRAAQRSAPFSKSAQDAAETAPGVGLGLALCRRLAKQLGGRLEIAQRNGANLGAAVTLRLPLT